MNIKELIEKTKYGLLTEREAYLCMQYLCSGSMPQVQKAAILSTIENRQVTAKELKGFASYLLEICVKPFEYEEDLIDVCGTGGDGHHTLNISTLSALVLASCGVKVCKHGNYGATSVNGSSNILEYVGYSFKRDSDSLRRELDAHNITFLHAPLFHPQLKILKELRADLSMRTVFNVLGPMVNPMQPQYRFTGVSSLGIARLYHYTYQSMHLRYNIVYSIDGHDEITLTNQVKVFSDQGEALLSPHQLSTYNLSITDLQTNKSMESAAELFRTVLQSKFKNKLTEVVVVNAAKAYALRKQVPYAYAYEICNETLLTGKTNKMFNQLIQK